MKRVTSAKHTNPRGFFFLQSHMAQLSSGTAGFFPYNHWCNGVRLYSNMLEKGGFTVGYLVAGLLVYVSVGWHHCCLRWSAELAAPWYRSEEPGPSAWRARISFSGLVCFKVTTGHALRVFDLNTKRESSLTLGQKWVVLTGRCIIWKVISESFGLGLGSFERAHTAAAAALGGNGLRVKRKASVQAAVIN